MTIPAGTWVELELLILAAQERAPGIPADTAAVPFMGRVRGFLVADSRVGATAQVRTRAGRIVSGTLRAALPKNVVDFGDPSPELFEAAESARARLAG